MFGSLVFADLASFTPVLTFRPGRRLLVRAPPCAAIYSVFLCRLKINLFKHLIFLPTGARQDFAAVLHHVRMPAQISGGIFRPQSPNIGVLANQIVDPSGFTAPVRVFPRTADRGDVFEPGSLGGKLFHFVAIAEFPRAAAALQAEEFVIAGHGRTTGSPVLIQSTDIADKRS